MNRFIGVIDKQIESTRVGNIFLDNPELFRFTDETVYALSHVNELDSDSQEFLVDYLTNKAIQEFCSVSQYYYFDTKSKEKLRIIYSELLANVRTGAESLDHISDSHFKSLKNWLGECNPFAEKIYSQADSKVQPVACSEYSSDLQVKILQIENTQLKEPVLDIGCGKKGNLVNDLCLKGIESYGIDRFSFTGDNFFNSDWLEYDYGIDKWGTIISNLGFSNHFKHHNIREDGNYIEYGRKYMEILKSLKVGGEFYYTPDLPFIEQYLDSDQFKIDKNEIDTCDFKVTKITRLT